MVSDTLQARNQRIYPWIINFYVDNEWIFKNIINIIYKKDKDVKSKNNSKNM